MVCCDIRGGFHNCGCEMWEATYAPFHFVVFFLFLQSVITILTTALQRVTQAGITPSIILFIPVLIASVLQMIRSVLAVTVADYLHPVFIRVLFDLGMAFPVVSLLALIPVQWISGDFSRKMRAKGDRKKRNTMFVLFGVSLVVLPLIVLIFNIMYFFLACYEIFMFIDILYVLFQTILLVIIGVIYVVIFVKMLKLMRVIRKVKCFSSFSNRTIFKKVYFNFVLLGYFVVIVFSSLAIAIQPVVLRYTGYGLPWWATYIIYGLTLLLVPVTNFIIQSQFAIASFTNKGAKFARPKFIVSFTAGENDFRVTDLESGSSFKSSTAILTQNSSTVGGSVLENTTASGTEDERSMMKTLAKHRDNAMRIDRALNRNLDLSKAILSEFWGNLLFGRFKDAFRELFVFPNPVDELDSRLHALSATSLMTIAICSFYFFLDSVYFRLGTCFISFVVLVGFQSRLLFGPKFDLQAWTIVNFASPIAARFPLFEHKFIGGGQKRFAQFVGCFMMYVITALYIISFVVSLFSTFFGYYIGLGAIAMTLFFFCFTMTEFAYSLCVACGIWYVVGRLGLVKKCDNCFIDFVVENPVAGSSKQSYQTKSIGSTPVVAVASLPPPSDDSVTDNTELVIDGVSQNGAAENPKEPIS